MVSISSTFHNFEASKNLNIDECRAESSSVKSITNKTGQKDWFDEPLIPCKPMMFSDYPNETARFPKEELNEEIEEEKEIQQDRSRSEMIRGTPIY